MKDNNHLEKLLTIGEQRILKRNYWKEKFSNNFSKTIFPYDSCKKCSDKKEINSQLYQDKEILSFSISDTLFSRIEQICGESNHTLHLVLMTCVMGLLYKYSNNNDITVGTPIYNQEIDGEFTNTLLTLRCKVEEKMTFKEFLFNVQRELTASIENQNFPIEVLIKELNLDDGGDFPLFDVLLILENIQKKEYIKGISQKINIIFAFKKGVGGIEGQIIYSSHKYHKETIQQIVSYLLVFLEASINQIDLEFADIFLLSEEDKQKVLFCFNKSPDTQLLHPVVHDWFEEQVNKTPGRIAVIGKSHEIMIANEENLYMKKGKWKIAISYQELNERANQIANLLNLKGVMANTVVGIILERSIDLIISIIGALKAGGAYLPINPGFPKERILYMLNDGRVSVLLTSKQIEEQFSYTELLSLNLNSIVPHRTPKPNPLNFDALPKLDRSLINYDLYTQYIGHAMVKHSIGIQPTRGCPFHCTYCHRIWPKNHTFRTAENLYSEVEAYYKLGIKRFVIIDDVFNFNIKNSLRFFELIIKNKLQLHLFFPNGMRGDILSKDYIDRMVEAGTVNLDLALETASPRIQKLIGKNLNLDKLKSNLQYLCQQHPHVVLDLGMMIGFPTETEEEAMMTMDFLKEIHWVHFPYPFILKIHPNTEIGKLAIKKGISPRSIYRSMNHSYHDIPETLPFSKRFAREYKAKFMSEYFFLKSRLKHVLPQQMKIATEDELVQKYNNYLPMEIKRFSDIISYANIPLQELGEVQFLPADHCAVPEIDKKIKGLFPIRKKNRNAFRVLLLDVSELFSSHQQDILHGEIPEPLGLMSLLTYLNEKFREEIFGKVTKSRVDFDSFEQLKTLVEDFKPDLIGMRTLSYYKDFFHRTVSQIRKWGIDVPIVAGGPYATMDYAIVLQDPNVDIAVLGEGEGTFAELVKEFMKNGGNRPGEDILKKIKGIAYICDKDQLFLRKSFREIINIEEILDAEVVPGVFHTNQPADPNSLAYVMYTSGSTGKPKGVMLEHRNVVNLLQYDFQCTNMDFSRMLQFHTIGFDASFHEIFCAFLSGGELILINSNTLSNIAELFETISENHIKTLFFPTSFLRFLFSEDSYVKSFPRCVSHIQVAGEQIIISDKLKKYLKENNIYFHNHYGPTETHVVTALTVSPGEEISWRPSIGKPITNTLVYILDNKGNLLPPGIVGELYIGGIQVGRGYLNNPELTAERFRLRRAGGRFSRKLPPCTPRKSFLLKQKFLEVQKPFYKKVSGPRRNKYYRTGDLSRWMVSGNIEFLGRMDHQVKVRGFRVELGDIEIQLLKYPGIKESVVIINEDENRDNILSAYFVAKEEIDISDVRDFLSLSLPDYMIPNYFIALEGIPLTANGKVDRKSLPEPSMQPGQALVLPRNLLERKLMKIWNNVLGNNQSESVPKIGIDSNFFDLGGQSLKATILISKLHREFRVLVPLVEIFKTPTIRGLSNFIQNASRTIYTSIKPVEKREYYPLSSSQKRLYILRQLDLKNTAYNMPFYFPLSSEINPNRLERIFIALINRHESLRTSFHILDNQPVQQVHEEVNFKIKTVKIEEGKSTINKEIERNGSFGYKSSISGFLTPDVLKNFIYPFDLSKAPLFRVGLLKTGKSEFLFIDMHHIITDGASVDILSHDFLTLINDDILANLPLQYKDYSIWQNSSHYQKLIENQKNYWVDIFSDEIPVLELPIDYSRPLVQDFNGCSVNFVLLDSEVEMLRQLAYVIKGTLFIILLSLFTIFLSKLSGQDDIVIGTPIANRRHADLEGIIGVFINSLAIRNFPSGEKTFKDFLNEVKTCVLSAIENQEYPFEDLVDHLEVSRDTSRNPLFDVMFNLVEPSESTREIAKEINWDCINPNEHRPGVSKFDMTLRAFEREDGIIFTLEYCKNLFKATTIDRFIHYFKKLVDSLLRDSNPVLSEIEIITLEEKQQILNEFNYTDINYSREKSYIQLFLEQVEKTPDNIALIGRSGLNRYRHNQADENVFSTYQQLNENSAQLSQHLIKLGTGGGNGKIIGLMTERTIEMVIGLLGILKSGSTYLPIGPEYPFQRVQYMLEHTGASILIVTDPKKSFMGDISSLLVIIDMSEEPGTNGNNIYDSFGYDLQGLPSDLIYVMYTSGTTGTPKGVMIENRSVVNFIKGITDMIPFGSNDRILSLTTLSFDIFGLEVLLPLVMGSGVVIGSESEQLDTGLAARSLIKEQITVLQVTPSRLQLLLSIPGAADNLKGISKLIVGGEEFPNSLLKKTREMMQGRIYNVYGPTETTIWSTIKEVTHDHKITIGRPLANTHIYIIDYADHLQPVGIAGELCIAGHGLARGYFKDEQLTKSKFSFNPFIDEIENIEDKINYSRVYRTGDLGRWLQEGNIEFLGRIDHQVKLRGYRIELREIGSQLLKINGIKEAVVLLIEKSQDKHLCAYIVFEDADIHLETNKLKDELSKHLPLYMIPSFIMKLDKIPLTANGKINRKALPAPGFQEDTSYIAPRNEIESQLVKIWEEILNRDVSNASQGIGIDANFFALGGHSLKATMLVAYIQRQFGVDVSLAEIFNKPTIRQLSVIISTVSPQKSGESILRSIRSYEKREYYPLSYAQRRLWILCQFEEDSTAYNIPSAVIFEGNFQEEIFIKAIETMTQRHESMRTVFMLRKGEPYQKLVDFTGFPKNFEMLDLRDESIENRETKTRRRFTEIANRAFNLEKGPLFYFRLLRWETDKCVFIYNIHHIISDGWSLGNISYEIMTLYNSYLDGEGNSLPILKLQYKDYSLWHTQLIEGGEFNHIQSYWLEKFKDKPNGIELPLDLSRRAIQTFNGERLSFFIDVEKTGQLNRLSHSIDGTLFMSLLTLLNIFLYRYSGQRDIIIGAPVANRKQPELYSMMGFLVNTLVFRNQLTPEQSSLEILKAIKVDTLECYQNQDFPFDLLVDQLELDRDLSQSPLFNVMLAHNNAEPWDRSLSMKGVNISPYPFINDFNMSKFDLIFFMDEVENQIQVRLEYNNDLFNRSTIQRMKRNFLRLLDDILLRSEEPVWRLNLLCDEEHYQVIDFFNSTAEIFPFNGLQKLFENQVERSSDSVAVVSMEETGWAMGRGSTQITYGELNRCINRFANYLRDEYGVKPNNILGVSMERSIDMIIVLLGIIKSGGAYLALDPTYPRDRVLHVLSDSNSDLLVIDQMRPELFENYQGEIFNIQEKMEELQLTPSDNIGIINDPSDILYVNYTSGSTGTPNGAMLSHDTLTNLIQWQKEKSSIDVSMSCMQFTSINFCVSFQEIMGPLTGGGRVHLIGEVVRQDIDYLMNFLSCFQVELLFLPFSYLNFLFNESNYWHHSFQHNLKHIITAGEQLKVTVGLKRFLKSNPIIQLHNHYGSTEMHVVTSYTLDGTNAALTPIPPAGFPISNVKIYILDDYLQPTPIGVWGELYVQGCSEILGYINNDSLTRVKLIDHEELSIDEERLYRSGDVGRWHEDGTIELRGRKDSMVKVRGFRIELGEVESKILSIEGVRECVVVVRENSRGEKNLLGYVSIENISVKDIERKLSKDLPHYMIPQIIVLKDLPLMPNGKVDRERLPDPVIDANEKYVSPHNSIEEKLVNIWAGVLKVEQSIIGIDDNFFDLGGHSLKATTVINNIHEELMVNIPLIDLFQQPTIRELSVIINQLKRERYRSIASLEKMDYYDLSSVQRRLFILNQLEPDRINYNMSGILVLPLGFSIAKMEQIFIEICQRQESFRTSFHMVGDIPVQKIHDDIQLRIENYAQGRIEKESLRGCDKVESIKSINHKSQVSEILKRFIRPFDLAIAPLLRLGLINLNNGRVILMVDMHHIISDGVSLSILVKDFLARFKNQPLNKLPIQYKDFASWQNSEISTGQLNNQEKYWLEQLSGELPILNLPLDFPRPKIQSFSGSRLQFEMNISESQIIKEFCRNNGVTLYVQILATVTVWLFKLCQQEDIIIGTPIANRRHRELEKIIGMFTNTLCMRNFPISSMPFKELLESVSLCSLAAFENQDYSFEDLVEKVLLERDTSRNPIFDVMVNVVDHVENNKNIEEILKGPRLESSSGEFDFSFKNETAKFDMNLTVYDMGTELLFEMEYCTALFKEETVERLIGYFKNILKSSIENSDQKLSQMEFLKEEDRIEILRMCTGEESEVEGISLLHEWFDKVSQINALRISLVHQDSQLTYSELGNKANQLAEFMKILGVQGNNIVGVMLNRSFEMVIGILAILKAGGGYLPIDPGLPIDRILYMLSDSGASALITTTPLKENNRIIKNSNRNSNLKIIYIEDIQFSSLPSHSLTFSLSHFLSPSHSLTFSHSYSTLLAYVIYTSGTTGRPKGVMINHYNVVNLFKYQYQYTNIDNSRILQFATLSFDASFHEIFSALLFGGTLYLINKEKRSNIEELFQYIEMNKIKTVFFPMSFLRMLFGDKEYLSLIPNCLRHIQTAGEQVVVSENFRDFLKERGIFLHNHYGPSETHVVTTITLNPQEEIPELPSIGRPILNTSIFILDEGGNLLPIGIIGELCIGGIQVGRGYLNNPELTSEKLCLRRVRTFLKKGSDTSKNFLNKQKLLRGVQGGGFLEKNPPARRGERIYKTGDLSRWLVDGNIEFLGRMDHQVKIRGYRVELGEIESRLLEFPGIKECVVIARKEESGNQYLCAYIVSDSVTESRELREHLAMNLPDYMVPLYFVKMEHIPVTNSGKFNRKELPEPLLNLERNVVPPQDDIERQLINIWMEVLCGDASNISQKDTIPEIGIDCNFFELGGHSLKAMMLISKLHRVFQVKVPLSEIFKSPTIRGLSNYIQRSSQIIYTSINPVEKRDYYPLSSSQKRLFVLQQLDLNNTVYNMQYTLVIPAKICMESLEKAFNQLIQRHESLRTSFHTISDQVVQRIHNRVSFNIEYYNHSEILNHEDMNCQLNSFRGSIDNPDEDCVENSFDKNQLFLLREKENSRIQRITKNFVRPFDLSIPTQLRVGIINSSNFKGDSDKLEKENLNILMVDLHHIISDGISMTILLRDFNKLYYKEKLSKLSIQYKDFSVWQRHSINGDVIKRQELFWLSEFTGELSLLDIPYDFPRPRIQDFSGATIQKEISIQEISELRDLLKGEVTLFMVLLAVLNILLAKMCNQEDITIGTITAGRNHVALEKLMGMFLNTIALRNYPGKEKTFSEFLSEIKSKTIKAFENQDYPFEELVNNLNLERDGSRNPLFDVMFILQNYDSPSENFLALDMNHNAIDRIDINNKNNISKFDLTLYVYESSNQIRLSFEYNTNLFKEETIEGMTEDFISVLRIILQNHNIVIQDINLEPGIHQLTEPEIIADFNI